MSKPSSLANAAATRSGKCRVRPQWVALSFRGQQAEVSAVPPLREPLPFRQVTSQLRQTVAATNKRLAQKNTIRRRLNATEPGARRDFLGVANWGKTPLRVSAAGLHPLFGGAKPQGKTRNANRDPKELLDGAFLFVVERSASRRHHHSVTVAGPFHVRLAKDQASPPAKRLFLIMA